MKRVPVILIALVLLLCLCACSQSRNPGSESPPPSPTVAVTENSEPQPTACDHDWIAATCTAPKTCSKCNLTEGSVVHKLQLASCTSPTTYTLCGMVSGTAYGHDYDYKEPFRCKRCNVEPYVNCTTLYIHYNRPDGDYENWNLWLWDNEEMTHFEPPYEFEIKDGEAVCKIKLTAGTRYVGYIVRYGEWEAKDIEEDQYIDLMNVYGSAHFYSQYGIKSGKLVVPLKYPLD